MTIHCDRCDTPMTPTLAHNVYWCPVCGTLATNAATVRFSHPSGEYDVEVMIDGVRYVPERSEK